MSNITRAHTPTGASLRGALGLSLFLFSLAATACAPSTPAKSQVPQKEAKRAPSRSKEPLHVAPPPDYGNKIVLCDRESDEKRL